MVWNCRRFVMVALVVLGAIGSPVRAQDTEELGPKLYTKIVKSSTFIFTAEKKLEELMTGGKMDPEKVRGLITFGSGVLIDAEQKLVLTAWQSVEDRPLAYVFFPIYQKDGSLINEKGLYIDRLIEGATKKTELIQGRVVYKVRIKNMALIKLDRIPADTPAVPMAHKSPRPNTKVWCIGNAIPVPHVFGLTSGDVRTVGDDIFVQKNWRSSGDNFEVRARVITTTNPINPGDWGGPLYDKNGHLVGIAQSSDSLDGGQRVNRFIDVLEIRSFLMGAKVNIKELVPKSADDPKIEPPKDFDPPAELGKSKSPEVLSADETAAKAALKRAKIYAEGDDNRKTYIDRLNDVIKKYPGTAAAKEAKKLLEGLGK